MSADFKSTIDKLFDDDLFQTDPAPVELPKLEIPSEPSGGLERREFNRADILERKIEVNFKNSAQFAKQYIENISIGGLFVKTNQKLKHGNVVPISFNVGDRTFDLIGRVCRVRDDGVGLEFIDLRSDIRADLETFVQTTLPQGLDLKTKAKQSTINRLQEMRDLQKVNLKKRKSRLSKVALIVILLAVNAFLFTDSLLEVHEEVIIKDKRFTLNEQEIYEDSIRSIQKTEDGSIVLNLENNSSISISNSDANKVLPYHLRQTYLLLRSTPMKKEKRISKTAPRISRLR